MFFLEKKKNEEKKYRKEEKNTSDTKGFKINKNENEVTLRR